MKRLKVHMVDLSKVDFSAQQVPLLQKILASRGISNDDDLNHKLSSMPSPDKFRGMTKAVDLLIDVFQKRQRILILGDYDADGATSTALAVRVLREMGAADVDFLVPNRFEYGYGLSREIAGVASGMHPDLVITVDNGISSIDGIAWLQSQGIKVLVTDHHLPGSELPDAAAILNPNQPDCDFPSKNLAGVGVLFYLMISLRRGLCENGWFEGQGIAEPKLEKYLDLVALGTVADLVPLDRVNRIFVTAGLKLMRTGQGNPGIAALFNVSGRNISAAQSSDLGFAVGPRINAAGRLDDISEGIRCLLAENHTEAQSLALELHQINLERRQIQEQMLDESQILVDEVSREAKGELPWGLCCYRQDWHQGVVGLVASRLKDNLHRPIIAFAQADPDNPNCNELKGSGRSISSVHIRDVLDRIATQSPGLVQKFGGHAMAAGLSIKLDDYDKFSEQFDFEVRKLVSEDDLSETLWSDGELSSAELSMRFAREIADLLPWGQKLSEPNFHGKFVVEQTRWLKDKHLKLQLRVIDPGYDASNDVSPIVEAIWFNAEPCFDIEVGAQISLLYRLGINEYRGKESLQLMIVDHLDELTLPA